ncbi:MAG: helix-turn-helix domain-containing protein [Acetatifactor sp.]
MNREYMLRSLILDRYTSLRKFAREIDIPYSTLMTLLSRDVGGASFDIVIKICRKLEIDPLELSQGNIMEMTYNGAWKRLE